MEHMQRNLRMTCKWRKDLVKKRVEKAADVKRRSECMRAPAHLF